MRVLWIALLCLAMVCVGEAQSETNAPPATPSTPEVPVVAGEPTDAKPQEQAQPAAEPEKAPEPPKPDENQVLNAAVIAYNDGLFERSEKEFAAFCQNYPNSTNLVRASVYQGLSLFRQQKYTESLAFFRGLNAQTDNPVLEAGKPIYCYWIGRTLLEQKDYAAAVTAFNDVLKQYPTSDRVPNALYYTGLAWRYVGEMKHVLETFESEQFNTVAEKDPNNVYVIQGRLLQSEIMVAMGNLAGAQGVLEKVATNNLPPELQWKRLFLLSRVSLSEGDLGRAGVSITNLLTLTTSAGLLNLEYRALALQGDLLKRENRMDEAAVVYERNIANKVIPIDDRWLAVLNTVQIKLAQGKDAEAIGFLQGFKDETANPPYSDELLMSLGSLQQKQYYQDKEQTELLSPGQGKGDAWIMAALENYQLLRTYFTNSTYLPKVALNMGLCQWERGQVTNALENMAVAVMNIPTSEDNALARVKLAEMQFYQQDFNASAATTAEYAKLYQNQKEIPSHLQEQALHIQLCSAVQNSDDGLAKSAMAAALTAYPKSPFTERDLIYLGNYLCDIGQAAEGRSQFQECLKLFPESKSFLEVSYSMARSWLYENKYDVAIKAYQQWLEQATKDSPLYLLAQFELAWCYAQNGNNEDAMTRFRAFLKEYPATWQAVLARKWIGDYYFNSSDFATAEQNYQLIFEESSRAESADPMVLEARIMAARSAFSRGAFRDSADHLRRLLTLLLAQEKPPIDVLETAYLMLGDALTESVSFSGTEQSRTTRFAEAINAYSRINVESKLGAIAMGRIANCHFQLAGGDPPDMERMKLAEEFYTRSMNASQATVETRSLSEIGLATLLQQQSHLTCFSVEQQKELLNQAMEHYLNVYLGKNVGAEMYSPFCVQRAGMEAARIFEAQGQWRNAMGVYERLYDLIPSMQPLLKRKMEYVQKYFPHE